MKLFGEKITPTDSFDKYLMTSLQGIDISMYFGIKDEPHVKYWCPPYSLVVQGRKHHGVYNTNFSRESYIGRYNTIVSQKFDFNFNRILIINEEDDEKRIKNNNKLMELVWSLPIKEEWKSAITNLGKMTISLKRKRKIEYFFYEVPMKTVIFNVFNWLKVNTFCFDIGEKEACIDDNAAFKKNVRQLFNRMNIIDLINNRVSYISVKGCRPFIILKCDMIHRSMEKYTLDPTKNFI